METDPDFSREDVSGLFNDERFDKKRTIKSLGTLTQKFVTLLQKSKDGILDLKYVSNIVLIVCIT